MSGSEDRRHVVIVGGGVAGLAAAECIVRHHPEHFRVSVLEAKRVAGGRAGSFTDPDSGETLDYCQHVAMGCCTNLIGLLSRCGLTDALRRYKSLTFFHPHFPPSKFTPSTWLPAPLHLASVIGKLNYLNRKQKNEIRRGLWKLIRSSHHQLDHAIASEWLQSHGQSAETIRLFWDVILTSALGESSQHASMTAARKVFVDGFAAARGASDVLVPDRPLSTLFGRDVVGVLTQLGVKVRCATPAQKIQTHQGNLQAVLTSDGQRIAADHVISAVPWHTVARLFDDPEIARILPRLSSFEHFPSSPISGLHLWFDRPITERPHAVLVDTLTQWLFRQPCGQFQAAKNSSEHYYQVVISGSHPMSGSSKDEIVRQVLSELGAVFPPTKSATLLRHRVVTDPNSVFSVRPTVEQLRPSPSPAPEKLPWLCLAGDWTRTGWPATMEGAVISGIQAAGGVFENAGLPSIAPDPGLKRGWLANCMIAH
ncbi:15-cis-phytoene desaturase [Novipirellula galeiformis]|uniref:15-cis-phytoene desaturase n=1 Tax=Novipirellula galeiformis TaxID=2528004 RepID=A0A5C6CPF9_9BACT|nr:hydroxysqualene dehydroxylase HpnE [Novipirellula galeiformis]TWU26352.1 15-cis-phytoene desaturase [Novipirellula galeiformis]